MNLQHIGSHTPALGVVARRALADGLPASTRPVSSAPPMNETVRLAMAAAPERAASGPRELREHALLAEDVYNDTPKPPPGYRVADAGDLQALRLDPADLGTGSFRARVYVTGSGGRALHHRLSRHPGARRLGGLNPGAKHGMDWVLSSLPR